MKELNTASRPSESVMWKDNIKQTWQPLKHMDESIEITNVGCVL